MSGHTQGPWHWEGDSLTHRQFNIYAPNNAPSEHVCTVNNLHVEKLWQRDAAQAQANARLIAAAPELLVALEDLVTQAEQHVHLRPEVKAAWEVIAKAKGEGCTQ